MDAKKGELAILKTRIRMVDLVGQLRSKMDCLHYEHYESLGRKKDCEFSLHQELLQTHETPLKLRYPALKLHSFPKDS